MGKTGPSRWKHPTIKFGTDKTDGVPWNKLTVDEFYKGREFTTFRVYGPGKDEYYRGRRGDEFAVVLDGKNIGFAELMSVEMKWSDKLSLKFIKDDTFSHYTKEDFKKLMKSFYGCTRVYGLILVFKVTKLLEMKKRTPAYVPPPEVDERQKSLGGF